MRKSLFRARGNELLIAFNLVCVALIVSLFLNYNAEYHAKLYDQNIRNIDDLNCFSATVAQSVFEFREQKIRDMARYIEANAMTLEETLDYLAFMNDDSQGDFELIGTDNTGYTVETGEDGAYLPLSYEDASYGELQRLFAGAAEGREGQVSYTPEFTDAYSAFKSFAFYAFVRLAGEEGASYYTIMFVSRSDDILQKIEQVGDYADLSVALMDDAGNYIIGNAGFKSENFFKYLYVFNDLTLDEKNALSQQVLGADSGTLTYKNSLGEDCVFVFGRLLGEAWYSVSCVPLASFTYQGYDNGLTILVAAVLTAMLVLDILWLDQLNRQLKESVASERKANEAKTEFLSRMSHDIRTPLNAILGFTALTKESPRLDPGLKDNLSKIDSSGHYLLGIVNDVLDMAKIESGKVELREEATDCERLFADILEIFSGEAERKNITLKTDFDLGAQRYLTADALRTKQIFSNLLSNAIKFSDDGTQIEWTVTEEPAEAGRIDLLSVVRDHGCGMSQAFLQNLFDPFSQEQNVHSRDTAGTGLGLAIVGRLVKLMDGSIDVKSQLGQGTEVTVRLPFSPCAPSAGFEPGAGADERSLPALTGKRVLLCEDNALNREIAAAFLKSYGLVTETAENGAIGVEKFARSEADFFDIVLMDIRMPVMDGLQAAAAIRALDRADAKRVPIIAMTANAYDEDVRASLDAGMNAHLTKPFEPDDFLRTLRRYLLADRKAGDQ